MISIILCFHKNTSDVERVYESIVNKLKNSKIEYEIIMINDNYKDETWEQIKEITKQNLKVKALSFVKNYGQHTAIFAGLKQTSGNSILYFDSDRDFDNKFLLQAQSLSNKNNIIFGLDKQKGFLRKIFILIYEFFTTKKFITRSIFFITKEVCEIIKDKFNEKQSLIGEVLFEINQNPLVIDSNFTPIDSTTRYTFFSKFTHALKHLILYSSKFYTIIILTSLSISILSIFTSIILIALNLLNLISFMTGWLSVIISITIFGSLNLLVLSVIGYTNLYSLNEVRNRPRYIIDEKININ